MDTPTHLSHKPIISVENYEKIDGKFANNTDAKVISIGLAQWENRDNDISAKVFRYPNENWSRQSEELPLHRVLDLSVLTIFSFMRSKEVVKSPTYFNPKVIDSENLEKIQVYFEKNKTDLIERINELERIIHLFKHQL